MPHEAPDAFEDHGGDVVARAQRFGDGRNVVGRQQDGLLDQARQESPPARQPSKCDIEPAVT